MELEFGNLGRLDTHGSGWFIGFSDWIRSSATEGTDLRHMPTDSWSQGLEAKWMAHRRGDPRGSGKPVSRGRSLSILVSETGRFALEFSPNSAFARPELYRHTLCRHGDYAAWGEGIHHRWSVEEDCVILTLRWRPGPGPPLLH